MLHDIHNASIPQIVSSRDNHDIRKHDIRKSKGFVIRGRNKHEHINENDSLEEHKWK